jgi:hypothetical protein
MPPLTNCVRFRREADMHERVVSTFSAANDPEQSLRGLKSRSAAVSCPS